MAKTLNLARLALLSLAFTAWIPVGTVLIWVWPAGVLVALAAGWWLARWCDISGWRGYLVALGPAALAAVLILGYSLQWPDAAFGTLPGAHAVLQYVCALASFAFVRHILRPAGV